MSHPRLRVLDFYTQSAYLRWRYPQFKESRWKESQQAWIGPLQPTLGSPDYMVLVIYRGRHAPHVHVLEPKLEKGPHRYQGDRLCLFDHREPGYRWEPDSRVVDTIVPWTATWLHYYELFLETGVWRGPQTEHVSTDVHKTGDDDERQHGDQRSVS